MSKVFALIIMLVAGSAHAATDCVTFAPDDPSCVTVCSEQFLQSHARERAAIVQAYVRLWVEFSDSSFFMAEEVITHLDAIERLEKRAIHLQKMLKDHCPGKSYNSNLTSELEQYWPK